MHLKMACDSEEVVMLKGTVMGRRLLRSYWSFIEYWTQHLINVIMFVYVKAVIDLAMFYHYINQ